MSEFILHFHWVLLKAITGEFSETGVSARWDVVNSLNLLPCGNGAEGDVAADGKYRAQTLCGGSEH